jgi:hypothetical protein
MYAQSGYRGAPGQAPPQQQQQGGYMQGGHMGLVNGMAGMALDRNGAPYGYANEAVVGMGGGMEGWGMEQARQAQQQATYAEGMQPEGAAMDPGLVSELMKMAPWLMPDGSGGGGPGGGGGGAAAAVGMAQQQQRYNAQAQYAAQYAGQGGQPAAMGALGGGMDGYMSQAAAMQQQQHQGGPGPGMPGFGAFRAGSLLAHAYGGAEGGLEQPQYGGYSGYGV